MSKQRLFLLPPNRVRRNYRGGAMLAQWDGFGDAVDGECPEDWIASTVRARNPGLPAVAGEGVSTVATAAGDVSLTQVIARDPVFMLGASHLKDYGEEIGFLTKLLDAGMRLHIQAHPTASFAQEHLASRWGKMEAYLILGVRDGVEGSLLLGFQHAPAPQEWRRIVMEQDKEAMLDCFEPIPVQPGELWFVPGGVPHAIGEGLLVIEIMEPTDLVVRCEFERDGLVVPPEARFMGRDPDFAMQIFHFDEWSPRETKRRLCVQPTLIEDADGVVLQQLFGSAQSQCFEVYRLRLSSGAEYRFGTDGRVAVGLVTAGAGEVASDGEGMSLGKGQRFLAAASSDGFSARSSSEGLEIVICVPLRQPGTV